MSMERRWGMRKPIEVDVVIDNQPSCFLRGSIGNVSVGGLYVRTEPGRLRMNSQVELVLMLQHEEATQVYRMPAMVVRLTANGAGLMFDQYDVNAFRTLVALLLTKRYAAIGKAARDVRADSVSCEDGERAASIPEDTTGRAALAARSMVSISSQPSPVLGESH